MQGEVEEQEQPLLRRVVLNGAVITVGLTQKFATYDSFRTWAYNAFNFPGSRMEYVIHVGNNAVTVLRAKDAFGAPSKIMLSSSQAVFIFTMEYAALSSNQNGSRRCCVLM